MVIYQSVPEDSDCGDGGGHGDQVSICIRVWFNCTQGWESVIHLEQKCHPELGMILTFCWQVKGEGIDGHQEANGHQKVCHTEAVPDGHLFR